MGGGSSGYGVGVGGGEGREAGAAPWLAYELQFINNDPVDSIRLSCWPAFWAPLSPFGHVL